MIAFLSLFLLAATPPDSTEAAEVQVRETVFRYVAPHDPTPEADLWRIAWGDLNGDGLDDALMLSGDPDWCGSGGCTLLVIEAIPEQDQEELGAYIVAAEIEMIGGPVRLSSQTHSGWRDLLVSGNDGTSVRLQFDGETYPFSPADGIASGDEGGTVLFAPTD